VLRRIRAIVTDPREHSLTRLTPAQSVFSGQTGQFKCLFQSSEIVPSTPVQGVLFGDLTRQRDGETEAILKILRLRASDQLRVVKLCESKEKPRESFQETSV